MTLKKVDHMNQQTVDGFHIIPSIWLNLIENRGKNGFVVKISQIDSTLDVTGGQNRIANLT